MKKEIMHRGEIIEIYQDGQIAAIKFRYNNKDRVECVRRYYSNFDFKLGDKCKIYFAALPLGHGFNWRVCK